jgi:hypothetical protein
MKYFIKSFEWMKSYNSPFKPPVPKLYIGKVALGTPYFFPRRWVKNKEKPGFKKAIPKIIGFDFVSLGWKTKWDEYRFEWSPMWSFVFFKWQIAVTFVAPEIDHYWECWLNYYYETKKTQPTEDRLEQARKEFPCKWTTHGPGKEKKTVCYWNLILKNKWL